MKTHFINRKIHYIIAVLCFSCFTDVNATPFFYEDFDNKTIPSSWQVIDNGIELGGLQWVFDTNEDVGLSSITASNGFALIQSGDLSSTQWSQNIELISSVIDCSDKPEVILSFYHRYVQRYSSIARLSISGDNGISWTTLENYSNMNEKSTYDISNYAGGQAQVIIKWSYQRNFDSYWAIDDVSLKEPTIIQSFEELEDYEVIYGTTQSELGLPTGLLATTQLGDGIIDISAASWILSEGTYSSTTPGEYTFTTDIASLLPIGTKTDLSTIIEVTVTLDSHTEDLISISYPRDTTVEYGYSFSYAIPIICTTDEREFTKVLYTGWWPSVDDAFNRNVTGIYTFTHNMLDDLPSNIIVDSLDIEISIDVTLLPKGNLMSLETPSIVKAPLNAIESSIDFPSSVKVMTESKQTFIVDISAATWISDEDTFDTSTEGTINYSADISNILSNIVTNTNSVSTVLSTKVQITEGGYFNINLYTRFSGGWNGAAIDIYINEEYSAFITTNDNDISKTIYAKHGDVIEMNWISGPWDYGNSFSVIDFSYNTLYNGLAPSIEGEFLTFMHKCKKLDNDLIIENLSRDFAVANKGANISVGVYNNGLNTQDNFNVTVTATNKDNLEVYTSTKQISNAGLAPDSVLEIEMDRIPQNAYSGEYLITSIVTLDSEENINDNVLETKFNIIEFDYGNNFIYYSYSDYNISHIQLNDPHSWQNSYNSPSIICAGFVDGLLLAFDKSSLAYYISPKGKIFHLGEIENLPMYGSNVNGITWDEYTNTIYLLTYDLTNGSRLFTLDIDNMLATPIGAISSEKSFGLTSNSEGTLYTSQTDSLYSINIDNFSLSALYQLPAQCNDLSYDLHNNIICGMLNGDNEDTLCFIDPTNGDIQLYNSVYHGSMCAISNIDIRKSSLTFEIKDSITSMPLENLKYNILGSNIDHYTDAKGMALVSYYETDYTFVFSSDMNDPIDDYEEKYFQYSPGEMSNIEVLLNPQEKSYRTTIVLHDALELSLKYKALYIANKYYGTNSSGIIEADLPNGTYKYHTDIHDLGRIDGEFTVDGQDQIIVISVSASPIANIYANEQNFYPALLVNDISPSPIEISMINYGGKDLIINGYSLIGKDASMFRFLNNNVTFPITIKPSERKAIALNYMPQEAGLHTANIQFVTNVETYEVVIEGYSYYPYSLPFIEDFNSDENSSPFWCTAKVPFDEESIVLDYIGMVTAGNPTHWGILDFENSIDSTNAADLYVVSDFTYDWLMTPVIDLGAKNSNNVLEFDMAINNYEGIEHNSGWDDRLVVAVSLDSGHTWHLNDTLRMWDNSNSPYVYDNIPIEGEHVSLSLAAYSGHIVVGFYGESMIENKTNFLIIDNVTIKNTSIASVDEKKNKELYIHMYPNPARDILNIDCMNDVNVRIIDLSGSTILQKQCSEGLQQLDISHLTSGIYLIYINNETTSTTKRLIVK